MAGADRERTDFQMYKGEKNHLWYLGLYLTPQTFHHTRQGLTQQHTNAPATVSKHLIRAGAWNNPCSLLSMMWVKSAFFQYGQSEAEGVLCSSCGEWEEIPP